MEPRLDIRHSGGGQNPDGSIKFSLSNETPRAHGIADHLNRGRLGTLSSSGGKLQEVRVLFQKRAGYVRTAGLDQQLLFLCKLKASKG